METNSTQTLQNAPIRVGKRFLRISDVMEYLGISRATVYRLVERDPTFPRPRQIAEHRVAWDLEELEAWAKARPVSKAGREAS